MFLGFDLVGLGVCLVTSEIGVCASVRFLSVGLVSWTVGTEKNVEK